LADGTNKAVFHILTELEKILCCGRRLGALFFARTHKSCKVALHHAVDVDRATGVLLWNAVRIPISRSEWAGLIATGMTIHASI